MERIKKNERLDKYRAKRRVEATPEPFGAPASERPRLFVIQKHAARNTHYDFRLEWGGTLVSWAVPHGPSPDPGEKRLAVRVEDHPVEYADFEGIIPPGNYGAGAVIVWDHGRWTPRTDPAELDETGKLHFELHGYKLLGEWILVRTKRGPNDWLLFKKNDAWALAKGKLPSYGEESILSGLTVEELRDGKTRADEIRAALARLGAPRRRVDPTQLEIMLAETADEPFSSKDWIYELKYDGYRLVAARRPEGGALLRYRNGLDASAIFPEIARAVQALPFESLVLDGEVVVLDAQGRPDFGQLQSRGQIRRPRDAERAAVENPVALFVFDLLGFEDFDLRALPQLRRKELLRRVLPRAGPLRFADHVAARGIELFEQVRARGLEGLLAKRAEAPYRAGRSRDWLKLVADRSGDFVVCGYTAPKGARAGFGALHVGAYAGDRLLYAGRVGSGFDARRRAELASILETQRSVQPPCEGELPRGKEHVWVKPRLVVEARYKTWTEDGLLRHPVFVRVRDDKPPEECAHPRAGMLKSAAAPRKGAPAAPGKPSAAHGKPSAAPARRGGARHAAAAEEPERAVSLTNLAKIFWPDEGYTKGDLIEYYRTIAPWLLPYLADRPLVLTRYPDGIGGKSFYQKDAPPFTPDWMRIEAIWSEGSEKEIRYIVCENLEALLFLANLGTIPVHVWSSRVATLQRPDWCILDLDPKGAPFAHVVELARAIHALCDDLGLPSFPKTSGSTGIHVLIPLGRQCTYEQSRMLGNLIARVIHDAHPEISTIARSISMRGGRVYLDFLQNRHSQLLVAPFSVRPLPGAPVSTPLSWSEVTKKLEIGRFTLRSVPERMKTLGTDPMRPVLEMKSDLAKALQKLARRVSEPGESPRTRQPRRPTGGSR